MLIYLYIEVRSGQVRSGQVGMNRLSEFMSFIFVSGFVSTSLAPLAMNLAMSSGSALPVTADKRQHYASSYRYTYIKRRHILPIIVPVYCISCRMVIAASGPCMRI